MSIRTIIEINHDHLGRITTAELEDLVSQLSSSTVTGLLNRSFPNPVNWSSGVRILAQRHHSETITIKVE